MEVSGNSTTTTVLAVLETAQARIHDLTAARVLVRHNSLGAPNEIPTRLSFPPIDC